MVVSSKFNAHPRETNSLTLRNRATRLPGWSNARNCSATPAKGPNESCRATCQRHWRVCPFAK
eukprot:11087255-Lingulodinium_polyedra.AAC.1